MFTTKPVIRQKQGKKASNNNVDSIAILEHVR